MSSTSPKTSNWLLGLLAVVALGAGAVAFVGIEGSGDAGNKLPQQFQYDLAQYMEVDPKLVAFHEVARWPLDLEQPRAVAVAEGGTLVIVGDKALLRLSGEGALLKTLALEGEPLSVAAAGSNHVYPGRIYVGLTDHVETFDGDKRVAVWAREGLVSVLTSIAVARNDVFVADAGERIVWRYDTEGKKLGRIGDRDEARDVRGFSIPSPYFDCAIGPNELLHVVNPAYHRIESFTFDGYPGPRWGKAGMQIEAFSGCCNPSNIAIFADGRVVTAEKGLPRVKVYSPEGEFESVVVGPKVLAPGAAALDETRDEHRLQPVDVAVRGDGTIFVLDPLAKCVRVYQPNEQAN
ncbi:MAG: hypothetical protein ACOY3P_08620 [Planctomycetota bacterium]